MSFFPNAFVHQPRGCYQPRGFAVVETAQQTHTREINDPNIVKNKAIDAFKKGNFKEFNKQFGYAKNIISKNNKEIKRLEELQASHLGSVDNLKRIDTLKKQNKLLGAVINLGNKHSANITRNIHTGWGALILHTPELKKANIIKIKAELAFKNKDLKEFGKLYAEAKKEMQTNKDKIKRLEKLMSAGSTHKYGNEIKSLKYANKKLNFVIKLGTTPANSGATTPPQTTTQPETTSSPVATNPSENTNAPVNTHPTPKEGTKHSSPTTNFAEANINIQSLKDEAGWAYLGSKRTNEFAELEVLTDKLNAAIARNASPKNIQTLAKAVNAKIDSLEANLKNDNGSKSTANNASIVFLKKAEKELASLIQNTNQIINLPATGLSESINKIPDSFKSTYEYKLLTALDKELNQAIMQGKDTKQIAKKINTAVDSWQAKLSNQGTPKNAEAAKNHVALGKALTDIEAQVSNVMHSGNAQPVKKPDNISIDKKNNIISIDSNQDGKIDYKIKMEGKDHAWTVTKMGADGKPKNSFRVWGDPHVDLDSGKSKGNKTDFNFFEDSTFVLKGVDGGPNIKITVDTKRKDGKAEGSGYKNGDVSYSSGLTITTGDQAVKVSGIDNNKVVINDVTDNGQKIDKETNDGTIFIINDDLSSMDTITESGRSHISDGNYPMYSTNFFENEYNEEEAYS